MDDETNETSGGDGGGGDGVSLDATPSPTDSGAPDTTVEEDTNVADSEPTKPDTATTPDTGVFVDTGFGFDTAIDTMVPDTFVPPSCTTPADCPFADLECAKKTCVAGKCGVDFTPKGTPTGPQTDGDCKRRECDGAGLAVVAYDPTDKPKDIGQCFNEYCDGATPKFDPFPVGTPCSTSFGTKCDGAGKCVQCITAADCPGTDGPCSQRTCTAGVCGLTTVPDGSPALVDAPKGDCEKLMCNVGGTITSTSSPTYKNYDATDLPSYPGYPCRIPNCDDGPSWSGKLPGTPCDGSHVCGGEGSWGDGVCGECDVDSDCYTYDTCKVMKCTAHACVVSSYRAVGASCENSGCPSTCVAVGDTGTSTACPYTCF